MTKVSIITATYNSEKTIDSCLQSVASQTIIDSVEHIIVDGRSSDATLSVVNAFSHVSKVISEPDRGIYHAFNKGVLAASGDIIYFLNSDDELADSDALEKIMKHFSDDVDYVHGRILFFDEATKVEKVSEPYIGQIGYRPKHPAFFCRRRVFDYTGLFNECLSIAADSYFMRKVVAHFNGKYLDDVITRFRIGGCSTLEGNFLKMANENKAVDLLLGDASSLTNHEKVNATLRSANVSLKKLVRKALTKSLSCQTAFYEKKIAIFGFMELSLIVKDILSGINISVSCFLTSSVQRMDAVEGIPVRTLQDAEGEGIDIVINCIEGEHEDSVSTMIISSLPDVSVKSWREL